jgi:hypothetical protein
MKWLFVKQGHFLQGLPARDLDDSELDTEQKALLEDAVAQGIYQAAPKAKPPKPSQGETNGRETETSGN